MTATKTHIDNQLSGLLKPRKASQTPLGLQTILIFGEPGSGKTSIAAAFPNHLYLDLENSATAHDIDELTVSTWTEFTSFVNDVANGTIELGDKQTLIIDTINDLWKLCRAAAFTELKIKDASEGDYGAGFLKPRKMFEDTINQLLSLSKRGIMGTVFIAHEEMFDTTAGNVKVKTARPAIDDKALPMFISGKPQMVLRTIKTDVHPRTSVPFTEPDENGVPRSSLKWLIQAVPEVAGASTKDRTGRLPAFFGATYKNLEAQYKKGAK
jgi:hypothetical protein